jgi:hypothetical protein
MRLDFFFSYWILAWFLAFQAGLVGISPQTWLWIGLAFNTVQLAAMAFYYHCSFRTLVVFVAVNIIIKVFPLVLLHFQSQPKEEKEQWRRFVAGLWLLVVYFVWLCVNTGGPMGAVGVVRRMDSQLRQDKLLTPAATIIAKALFHNK